MGNACGGHYGECAKRTKQSLFVDIGTKVQSKAVLLSESYGD